MSKTIQMKTTITEGGVKQQVNGYPITTPDRVIDGDGVSVEEAISEKQDMTDNSLETTNKQIVSAINEVNSLAKQANKAKSFVSYQALITYLNNLGSSEFLSGQIFNIQTTNVPDLWVFSVESTSIPYTYTSDADFINATKQIGGQQVGYYKLAQLEILIDLADYVKKTDYATTSNFGIVRANPSFGSATIGGTFVASNRTYAEYQSGDNQMLVGKGTLENVITGKGLNKNKFVEVTYGTTTYTEIQSILANGNVPYVSRSDRLYVYMGVLSGNAYFVANGGLIQYRLRLNTTTNEWSGSDVGVQYTNDRVTTITGTETDNSKYPSVPAVVNYTNSLKIDITVDM